jgi:hypothetical protein
MPRFRLKKANGKNRRAALTMGEIEGCEKRLWGLGWKGLR